MAVNAIMPKIFLTGIVKSVSSLNLAIAINYLLNRVGFPNSQRQPDDGEKRCYRGEPTSQGGDSASDCQTIHYCFGFLLHHLFFALPKLIARALTTGRRYLATNASSFLLGVAALIADARVTTAVIMLKADNRKSITKAPLLLALGSCLLQSEQPVMPQ